MKITLHKVKETKGTRVFAASETEDNPTIPTLYIRKHGVAPEATEIEVTIKVVK